MAASAPTGTRWSSRPRPTALQWRVARSQRRRHRRRRRGAKVTASPTILEDPLLPRPLGAAALHHATAVPVLLGYPARPLGAALEHPRPREAMQLVPGEVLLRRTRLRPAVGRRRGAAGQQSQDGQADDERSHRTASALHELLLLYRVGLAPPALIPREADVLARHPGRSRLAILHREPEAIARGEVRRVRFPRRPFVGRRTAEEQQHRGERWKREGESSHASLLSL